METDVSLRLALRELCALPRRFRHLSERLRECHYWDRFKRKCPNVTSKEAYFLSIFFGRLCFFFCFFFNLEQTSKANRRCQLSIKVRQKKQSKSRCVSTASSVYSSTPGGGILLLESFYCQYLVPSDISAKCFAALFLLVWDFCSVSLLGSRNLRWLFAEVNICR